MNRGIILHIPNPKSKSVTLGLLDEMGCASFRIHGSKIPTGFRNDQAVIAQYRPTLKDEQIDDFLQSKDVFPVLLSVGILDQRLSDYDNILILDSENNSEYINLNCVELFFNSVDFVADQTEAFINIVLQNIDVVEEKYEYKEGSELEKALTLIHSILLQMNIRDLDNYDQYLRRLIISACHIENDKDIDIDITENLDVFRQSAIRYMKQGKYPICSINGIEGGYQSAFHQNKLILYDQDYYYFFDNFLKAAFKSEFKDFSYITMKATLKDAGFLVCNSTKHNYTVKKIVTTAMGQTLRSRLVKIKRDFFDRLGEPTLVERMCSDV